MKGLTHYISGVAAATFFSQAMQMSQLENSFIIVLGGIFGILPDTLDFKFGQFFEKYDYIVDPDPINPDPQMIADTIAKALDDAAESKKPKSILMHTIKKGSDTWRQYKIFFDVENSKVRVTMGKLINFSKIPYPGSELQGKTVAEAPVHCKLCKQVYDKETHADIMSGPSFQFVPQKDGSVRMDFLSWHRRWSHSLTMGVYLGVFMWLLLGLWMGWDRSAIYGLVVTSGFWVHVLEDQLGYMGSNLFWPFTKEKSVGTKSMHSGDAWPNFSTIWLAVTLILFNMDANNPQQIIQFATQPYLNFILYMVFVFAAPLLGIYIIDRLIALWEHFDNKFHPIPVYNSETGLPERTNESEVQKEIEDEFSEQ